jgi:DMSO/TMAO reductase YedYZ molybdopterin-dependent catalytic subunit
MATRRTILTGGLSGLVLAGTRLVPSALAEELPDGARSIATLESLPGKRPLIRRSYRPPNYETPVAELDSALTANDRFFVRWHLANIPEVSTSEYRLEIGGPAASDTRSFTLDELRSRFERVECLAVCQCAGNRRGYSDPHVPGVQWGSGAVGNARWAGARLKDVLSGVGLASDALEVAFSGADRAPLDATPPFVKSLPLWKALDEHTLIAYEMNGEALPHWNGAPARLVVPGWAATYWMKQLSRIEVLNRPQAGFWMTTAYRIPKGKFPIVDRFLSQEAETTTPITEILVNSLITSPAAGARVPLRAPLEVSGVAWDGGTGVRLVELSIDQGETWQRVTLGDDLGRYSFRSWRHTVRPVRRGPMTLLVRASSNHGTTQPFELIFNGPGYHNNVVQQAAVDVG